jgi:hypothetical protein
MPLYEFQAGPLEVDAEHVDHVDRVDVLIGDEDTELTPNAVTLP